MSAGSGSSSSAGVAKAKARTSSSIPQMRATGVLRESPPSAVANANAPRSDRLEEEARRMEERLRQLKVAMTTEKQKRDAITKTKAGLYRAMQGRNASAYASCIHTRVLLLLDQWTECSGDCCLVVVILLRRHLLEGCQSRRGRQELHGRRDGARGEANCKVERNRRQPIDASTGGECN